LDEEQEHFPGGFDAGNDHAPGETTLDLSEIRASVEASLGAMNPVNVQVASLEAAWSSGGTRDSRARRAAEARLKGFEGDSCGACGNFTLVRNGTCMKCNTCGSTTGCS
jgi:ribonucleoside-diphosphate reductase alpha chain